MGREYAACYEQRHISRLTGFIDKTGHFVINPQFGLANSFSDGLAQVRIGDDETGKWGYIAR